VTLHEILKVINQGFEKRVNELDPELMLLVLAGFVRFPVLVKPLNQLQDCRRGSHSGMHPSLNPSVSLRPAPVKSSPKTTLSRLFENVPL
jgi:hypothetical protein